MNLSSIASKAYTSVSAITQGSVNQTGNSRQVSNALDPSIRGDRRLQPNNSTAENAKGTYDVFDSIKTIQNTARRLCGYDRICNCTRDVLENPFIDLSNITSDEELSCLTKNFRYDLDLKPVVDFDSAEVFSNAASQLIAAGNDNNCTMETNTFETALSKYQECNDTRSQIVEDVTQAVYQSNQSRTFGTAVERLEVPSVCEEAGKSLEALVQCIEKPDATTSPTASPLQQPTQSAQPSGAPSLSPSDFPTNLPSDNPTAAPTQAPTRSSAPTSAVSDAPSSIPSDTPSEVPSTSPVSSGVSKAELIGTSAGVAILAGYLALN